MSPDPVSSAVTLSTGRYAVYARKSTESEERQVQSIDDQVRLDRDLADRLGLAVACTLTESMSAKDEGRPEFNRLIALVKRGEIDGIIAWHPDRLSRNELDAAQITHLVRKGRLDLRFVNYAFDASPEGVMMLQMALSQSQYYSSKLSRDVLRGMDSKRRKGWFPHRAPEGYLNDLETHTIVADPERFPLIRRAWDLLLEGHTIRHAIDALNAQGYTTKRRRASGGGPLSRTSGYKIFTNPFYAGEFRERGQLYPGSHPAMVTHEEFDRAQALIRRNDRTHESLRPLAYRGLIRCARCGWGVTAEVQQGANKSNIYTYYHCYNRACVHTSIREDRFEIQVQLLLANLEIDPEVVREVEAAFQDWLGQDGAEQVGIQETQRRALAAAEGRQASLLDLRLRELLTDAEFAAKKGLIQKEIEAMRWGLERTKTHSEAALASVQRTLQFAARARELFRDGDYTEKRIVTEGLGLSYLLRDGRVEIEINPLCALVIRVNRRDLVRRDAGDDGNRLPDMTLGSVGQRVRTNQHMGKAPGTRVLELSKTGSGSTKKGPIRVPCFVGWAEADLFELIALVQQGYSVPLI